MKKQTKEQIRENLFKTLSWQCAERDDEYVAKVIKGSHQVDGVYTLEEAGLLDGFFEFMRSKGMIDLIQQVGSEERRAGDDLVISICMSVHGEDPLRGRVDKWDA